MITLLGFSLSAFCSSEQESWLSNLSDAKLKEKAIALCHVYETSDVVEVEIQRASHTPGFVTALVQISLGENGNCWQNVTFDQAEIKIGERRCFD